MKITLDLDSRLVWRLLAEGNDSNAEASRIVSRLLLDRYRDVPFMVQGPTIAERIQQMHARGMCDAEIGGRLNMTTLSVAEKRRQLRLPANRRYRKGHVA